MLDRLAQRPNCPFLSDSDFVQVNISKTQRATLTRTRTKQVEASGKICIAARYIAKEARSETTEDSESNMSGLCTGCGQSINGKVDRR